MVATMAAPIPARSESNEDSFLDEIELVVQGKELVVKQATLVRHSAFFAFLFDSLKNNQEMVVLKRGSVDNNMDNDNTVDVDPLSKISYSTMSTLVGYMESQELARLTEHTLPELLSASYLLDVADVFEQCCAFLVNTLNVHNCIQHLLAAIDCFRHDIIDFGELSIVQRVVRFVQKHFDVVANTQMFKALLDDVEVLELILAHDQGRLLNVRTEQRVLDAVLAWVEYWPEYRHQELHRLLEKYVQWPLIRDEQVLKNLINFDPLVSIDPRCATVVQKALDYRQMEYSAKLEYWKGKERPSRWPQLLVTLPYADKTLEAFDFESNSWFLLSMKPTNTFGAEICAIDDQLLVLGGVQTAQIDVLSLENNSWSQAVPNINENNKEIKDARLHELLQLRVAHGVSVCGSRIFVMGGSEKASSDGFGPGLSEMESLDLKDQSKWQFYPSMSIGRSYLASATDEEFVYVVAGCLTEGYSTAEAFEICSQQWIPMANTSCKRDSLGLVVGDDDKLYAIGGFDNLEKQYLKSVECYDKNTDSWTKMASMNVARRSPGVILYRGHIMVVGGMGRKEDLRSVEIYDTDNDTWVKNATPLKINSGWLSCCLAYKPLRLLESGAVDDICKREGRSQDRQNKEKTQRRRSSSRMNFGTKNKRNSKKGLRHSMSFSVD